MCPADEAALQAEIFAPNCASSGCHGAQAPAAGLDLVSPGLASRVAHLDALGCAGHPLVVPGDPASSFLVDKIANDMPACGVRMPVGRPALSAEDTECVRRWIASMESSSPDGGTSDAGLRCPVGLTACGTTCVDTDFDRANCGSCGNACGATDLCAGGSCAGECPVGTTDCGGGCVNTMTSSRHCGACGNACALGAACVDGACNCGPRATFSADVLPIFAASCANMSCHSGMRPAAEMSLEAASAYAALVNVATTCRELDRVEPGAPDKSYLVNKLLGVDMCGGTQMPSRGAALPADQMDKIISWICHGAAND